MKKIIAIVAAVLMLCIVTACNQKAAKDQVLVDRATVDSITRYLGQLNGAQLQSMFANDSTVDRSKLLAGLQAGFGLDTNRYYMEGAQIGMQMQGMLQNIYERYGVKLDSRTYLAELKKTFADTANKDREVVQHLGQELDRLMRNVDKMKSKKNIAAGEKYISDLMAADKSYKKTASGMVYKVIAEGEGANFTEADSINITYEGKKIDGSTFDKGTHKFTMSGVVPGFAEALKMMKPGSKMEIILPYNLAYGEEGSTNPMTRQQVIAPYETLIFTMEAVK